MVLSGKSKIFGNHQKELVTKEKIISFYINGKQHQGEYHFDKYNMHLYSDFKTSPFNWDILLKSYSIHFKWRQGMFLPLSAWQDT